MAAKLLHSLTDENPDLQKQIGCMTGVFQMFDRQHVLTSGSRRLIGHTPKRFPPGNTNFHCLDRESNNTSLRSASTEKYSTQERQRISTETSRASFSSSSRSSSLSSVDFNRAPQLVPAPSDRAISMQNSSSQFTRQSLDIRDLMKDSMHREIHGLSLKPKEETQLKTRVDLKESLKVLAKLQEPPWPQNEPRELLRSASYQAKEGSSFSVSKDAPRFSYDGWEVRRGPLDVPKSAMKLWDSRESLRDSKSSVLLKSMQKDANSVEFDDKVQVSQQAGGNQMRPPSVVAKLMGLEGLPDSVSSSNDSNSISGRSFPDEDYLSNIPKSCCSMRPISRFPIEPAPWKQIDCTKNSKTPTSFKAPPKDSTACPSVYSEIENKLKHLEFAESGKDLRALKQILEAMQSKGFLETKKEARDPKEQKYLSSIQEVRSVSSNQWKWASSKWQHCESPIVIMKPAKLVEKSGIPTSSVIPLGSLPGLAISTSQRVNTESVDNTKSLSRKSSQQAKAINSGNTKKGRTLKNTQMSSRVSRSAKDGNVGPGKITESINPRIQQKKIEKRSRPAILGSSKSRQLPDKQQGESNSPGWRQRPKLPGLQQSVDKPSEAIFGSRHCENVTLVDSSGSIKQSTRNSLVGCSEISPPASSCESSSVNASKFVLSDRVDKKSTSEAESAEFGFVPPEYSSPVSVLDMIVYKDDSASPVKYAGKTLKVDEPPTEKNTDPIAGQENPMDDFPLSGPRPTQSQINRKKLEKIETLVQELRRLNSAHDEARTDYIASLCEQTTNPDHRYISEILLASGLLLKELGSGLENFRFHPSGHPINPELFLVLEQTQSRASSTGGRAHRKLVFDTLNEILGRKLAGQDSRPLPGQAGRMGLSPNRILGDLCLEIERFWTSSGRCGPGKEEEEEERWKGLMHEEVMLDLGGWRNFEVEKSGVVLDIERSIFKDLVSEVVIGESNGLRAKPGRHRLFEK